jgi:hypothetical protein
MSHEPHTAILLSFCSAPLETQNDWLASRSEKVPPRLTLEPVAIPTPKDSIRIVSFV